MSTSSPAFAFEASPKPLVLAAARSLAAIICAGDAVTRQVLNHTMRDHFGGSDAEGRWSVRDAHAALELAQVLWLQQHDVGLTTPSADAERVFAQLDALIPSQTVRSDEQIELQQFATPPRIAWLAARACAASADELVLEPSAGTGMLALWAAKRGARLALNEISPLRRHYLETLFPDARVTGHDGELIDELLAPLIRPGAVLMNPPYSHGIERGHDSRTGGRHLRAAWRRLASGGRLVAIMPEWFDVPRFLADTLVFLAQNVLNVRSHFLEGQSWNCRTHESGASGCRMPHIDHLRLFVKYIIGTLVIP